MAKTEHFCALCGDSIESSNVLGDSLICHCGWTGTRDKPSRFGGFFSKKKSRRKVVAFSLTLLLVLLAFEWLRWESFFPIKVTYQIKELGGWAKYDDHLTMGRICNHFEDYRCAQKAFEKALLEEPSDLISESLLAIVESKRGNHKSAVRRFSEIVKQGKHSKEIYAYYGISLDEMGQTDKAIRAYYQALLKSPFMVNIADRLVSVLIRKKNYDEALSVIGQFSDKSLTAMEQFEPKIQQIYAQIRKKRSRRSKQFHLAKFSDYYFAPIVFPGQKNPEFFKVNSSANHLTLNRDFVKDVNLKGYKRTKKKRVATGISSFQGEQVLFKQIKIGRMKIKNVKAVICDNCHLAMGKSLLNKLKARTYRQNGIDYLRLRN